MTSISDAIGDTAVQEIVHPRALQEPSESFLASTRHYLEAKGWARAVAGDADFEAACLAWGRTFHNNLGIFEDLLDLLDTVLVFKLLGLCRIILGILGKVTLLACFLDLLCNLLALYDL